VTGALLLAAGAALWGCQGDKSRAEPAPPIAVPTTRPGASGSPVGAPPSMQVSVSEVRADPTVDSQSIRSALRDAESALLTCVDGGGSTGVVVLTFPIERDGAVGDIVEGAKTTYGSEAARVCMERIVATMKFPRGAHDEGRAEVTVTLEVSPRR